MAVLPNKFTVSFSELDGSPLEKMSIDHQKIGVTRVFRCASRDRLQLVKEFLGYTEVVGSSVKFHKPHSYVDIVNTLIAVDASTKPVGKIAGADDNRFAEYDSVDVEIVYRILQEETGVSSPSAVYSGLVTITEVMTDASEFVTVTTKGLFWGTGAGRIPLDPSDAPGKINNMLEWTYQVRGARRVPWGVYGFPGHINGAAVYSKSTGITFPPETLLCGQPSIERVVSYSDTTFSISLRFLAKNNGTFSSPLGWNHFANTSKDGGDISYERIYDKNDAAKIFYPLNDFNAIIIP